MRILLVTLLALAATPAFAATAHCESPDKAVIADVDYVWDADLQVGKIEGVRVTTENVAMSTYPGENGDRAPDVLAVEVAEYDRMQVGLESENVGPMTFRLDIVRTAIYESGDAQETDVVVAGVTYAASAGTATVTCTGW